MNPGFDKGIWEQDDIFVYKTSTYLKMWRGDFDGLDCKFFPR
jgi:hypothetical protein